MLIIILTPTVIIAVLNLVKYCVKCFTQYKELKLLVTSGKERVAITKMAYHIRNRI